MRGKSEAISYKIAGKRIQKRSMQCQVLPNVLSVEYLNKDSKALNRLIIAKLSHYFTNAVTASQ